MPARNLFTRRPPRVSAANSPPSIRRWRCFVIVQTRLASVVRLLAFLDHVDANRKRGHFMPQTVEVVMDCLHLAEGDVLLGDVVDGGAEQPALLEQDSRVRV